MDQETVLEKTTNLIGVYYDGYGLWSIVVGVPLFVCKIHSVVGPRFWKPFGLLMGRCSLYCSLIP